MTQAMRGLFTAFQPPGGGAPSRVAQVLGDTKIREEIAQAAAGTRALPKAELGSVTREMLARAVEAPAAVRGGPGLGGAGLGGAGLGGAGLGGAGLEGTPLPSLLEGTRPWTEAVILEYGRPTLLVRNGRFAVPDSPELQRRLLPARRRLEARIPSVGRIEFRYHPTRAWGGTGWMIAERTIVTNRHVAEEFCALSSDRQSIVMLQNFLGREIEPRIDFREEYPAGGAAEVFEVAVDKVLFLEGERTNPDIAFLRLAPGDFPLPDPIPILNEEPRQESDIAVVGYPARDFRGVSSTEAARRIFGDIYDVKRLSPGRVGEVDPASWYFTHDATTLGGNSGSVVLDVDTGYAVGLHFMGHLHEANFAVRGQRVLDALAGLRTQVPGGIESLRKPAPVALTRLVRGVPDEETIEPGVESVESYADREGYRADFLGDGLEVPLPAPIGDTAQAVLTFDTGEGPESVLRYTHFSVVMHEARRLCLYSAVNIDGRSPVKAKRPKWRLDPRIPAGAQILKECYGDPPKFSRGHMTRREDPMWGAMALRGNADSMHATNAVPQMQPFNGGIWLGLEDYALENARQDQMQICVFTGPFLRADDPEMHAVQIPVAFWKVIAFVHDRTQALCASGYTISQEDFLQPEEVVFGPYETYQVPLRWIAEQSGLDFGPLTALDVFAPGEEALLQPLTRLEDIRFAR